MNIINRESTFRDTNAGDGPNRDPMINTMDSSPIRPSEKEDEALVAHDSILDARVPKDEGNIIYYIYLLYGFSLLVVFNSILSTLTYFINQMPGYSPSFVVSFGFNLLVMLMLVFIMVRGHLIAFKVKNNLMLLL